MRVDDPDVSALEDSQEKLIANELKDDDDVLEGIRKTDALNDFSLVREDADIFKRRVIFSQSQDLSFVRCDGDRPAKGRNSNEHILMIESVEPFAEGVLREDITFVSVLGIGEVVPIVVHNI